MASIPSGWAIARLEEVVGHKKGKKPKKVTNRPGKELVPYLDIKAFYEDNIMHYAERSSSNLTSESDVLVVWDGARCGLCGMGKKGAIGSTIMALRPIEISTAYLFRFLQSKFDNINSNPRGTGIPHVDPNIFWPLEFSIAPLNEQHRIVAKLEKTSGKGGPMQSAAGKNSDHPQTLPPVGSCCCLFEGIDEGFGQNN